MSVSPKARPTLGFDTVWQAVVHLHGQGLPITTIAHETGSTVNAVATTLSKRRLFPNRQSTDVRVGSRPSIFLDLSPDLLPLLRPHAARRGLTCAALAALIIDTVAEQGLVDATLDDREG